MRKNRIQFLYMTHLIICLIWHQLQAQSFDHLFQKALTIHKQDPEVALDLFKQALILNPNSIEAEYNIAYVLKNLQQATLAITYYDKVLTKNPQNISAHIGKAQACLLLGDYTQGWKELEWRLGSPDVYTKELADFKAHGGSLKNKKIVLRAEWGAGDTIMLIRYAQLLHAQGAYVIVHLLHESLVPLFKHQSYLDEVAGPSQACPAFHFQLPMVSLPRLFETDKNTIPLNIPYLEIAPSVISKWDNTFEKNSFNIGVCWQGNGIHEQSKFMPLEYFIQLAQLPSVKLYSLQQHDGLDQIKALSDNSLINTFDTTFDQTPFFDTIGAMKHMNLIITVDTSIAHLAGAFAVPVWVILPQYADWRWMLNRNDSPWYPSMRLFRQKKFGDWQAVIDEVKQALTIAQNK